MVAIKLFVPNWQSRRGGFWACGVKHQPTAKPSAKKRSFPMTRRGAGVKGPKTVNHPHQVGLGELLSMASG
jgi:hypothetical protein